MIYLPPFAAVRNSVRLLSSKGRIKVDLTYDEFLDLVKKLLFAVPIDETWYRTTYPDVDAAIRAGTYRSARQHFVEHGYFEGRRPFDIEVDEAAYLLRYPDVEESVKRGLVESARDHFIRHGYAEGRVPSDL